MSLLGDIVSLDPEVGTDPTGKNSAIIAAFLKKNPEAIKLSRQCLGNPNDSWVPTAPTLMGTLQSVDTSLKSIDATLKSILSGVQQVISDVPENQQVLSVIAAGTAQILKLLNGKA